MRGSPRRAAFRWGYQVATLGRFLMTVELLLNIKDGPGGSDSGSRAAGGMHKSSQIRAYRIGSKFGDVHYRSPSVRCHFFFFLRNVDQSLNVPVLAAGRTRTRVPVRHRVATNFGLFGYRCMGPKPGDFQHSLTMSSGDAPSPNGASLRRERQN